MIVRLMISRTIDVFSLLTFALSVEMSAGTFTTIGYFGGTGGFYVAIFLAEKTTTDLTIQELQLRVRKN